ncbi:uncharacterized protein NECHADRAFT_83135 [Fusarium vanettenii 77-13-4]|uniref:Uncharacterized protein n=1 Tax=Fusarium vanettenii (strain ATCC MYA-4622 / CBS 123669 / FGSC 9596 / NRRL 45880 / 77-13-4) TaxID=660122 RepID=C7ZB20_FUSV7|nr:uncharacterized protein NECHADRAFT_83135 [Fusarium vanettenii 77-13-4]EEU38832.1 predicted protein [Fusarium vanettenii 77-13-4]
MCNQALRAEPLIQADVRTHHPKAIFSGFQAVSSLPCNLNCPSLPWQVEDDRSLPIVCCEEKMATCCDTSGVPPNLPENTLTRHLQVRLMLAISLSLGRRQMEPAVIVSGTQGKTTKPATEGLTRQLPENNLHAIKFDTKEDRRDTAFECLAYGPAKCIGSAFAARV